jgi:hypothetical protein
MAPAQSTMAGALSMLPSAVSSNVGSAGVLRPSRSQWRQVQRCAPGRRHSRRHAEASIRNKWAGEGTAPAGTDADCDGTVECDCIVGQGNGPCSGDPNNSRCNGQGQCVPCQTNADCSLVSGGRNRCEGGRCAPAQPFDCSDPSPPVGPEPPFARGGLNDQPRPTGGVIANGR